MSAVTEALPKHLHGPYRRKTAIHILAWAKRLNEEPEFYTAVQELAVAIRACGNIETVQELLPPLALALVGCMTESGRVTS